MKSNGRQRRVDGITRRYTYGRQREGDGHQHGRKPRIPKPVLIVWNSPGEEVRVHWTPMGVEPMDQ